MSEDWLLYFSFPSFLSSLFFFPPPERIKPYLANKRCAELLKLKTSICS